jgi:hypothetical protein
MVLWSASMRHPLGRLLALMVGAMLAITSCTGSEPQAVRAGEVYDAVVQWFAAARSDDPEPIALYVERWDDGPVDLATQAEVVASTTEVALVRFIDARDEAIEWIDDVAQVRNEGVLVRFGPLTGQGRAVTVIIDRWTEGDLFERWTMAVVQQGTVWQVSGEPVSSGLVEVV